MKSPPLTQLPESGGHCMARFLSRATLEVSSKTVAGWAPYLAALIAGAAVFSQWAVNAELFGKHDLGQATTFAFIAASAFIASFWLALTAMVLAVVAKAAGLASPVGYLLAAAIGSLPFLFLR
jgi:hypothetical protein